MFGLATIYGFMEFPRSWQRLLLMGMAFPLAVAGNVVRLLTIVVAAESFGRSAGNYVHENAVFSLLPYPPVIVGLMLLGHWLHKFTPPPGPPAEQATISSAPLPLKDLSADFLGAFFELAFPDKRLLELCRELKITTPGYRLETLPPDQVARVKSTCLYLATKLGDLMDELVVVGGLVPSLLIDQETLPENVTSHVGTLDLDLGLAFALVGEQRYQSVAERLPLSSSRMIRTMRRAAPSSRVVSAAASS